MTQYSDASEALNDQDDDTRVGPYIRDIPPLPVGDFKAKGHHGHPGRS
jgi:hypothetical protein